MQKDTKSKLVYGVGLNDVGRATKMTQDGKLLQCNFYTAWTGMLRRCYSKKYQEKYPTYIGCYVCDEWMTFGNFKAWMSNQSWQGRHLDKDILFVGNKAYSPDNCIFVDPIVNTFIEDRSLARGEFMIGASWHSRDCAFQSHCANPITKKREYLGSFKSDSDAHQAWKKRKHELACQLAELQTDDRVANALRARYL